MGEKKDRDEITQRVLDEAEAETRRLRERGWTKDDFAGALRAFLGVSESGQQPAQERGASDFATAMRKNMSEQPPAKVADVRADGGIDR